MAKDFLGRGWRFPVGVDGDGRIALSEHEQDVREAIRLVLSTSPGERVMRPEFGAGVHDFVFETLSATAVGSMQSAIRRALLRWEPRAELLAVEVRGEPGEVGTVLVAIDYRVRATNSRFNQVFPFYVEER
jgi:hypothetical protein